MKKSLTFFFILILIFLPTIVGKNIYVSPNGSDFNSGTINNPFRTISHAIKEANILTNDIQTIILRKGTYFQSNSLTISNLKNLKITAYPNEKVIISGGKELDKNCIESIKDSDVITRLKPSIRKKVKEIDFNKLNIQLIGISKRGFSYKTKPSWSELYINDTPLYLSKWPNDRMILIDSVINTGNIIDKNIINNEKPIIRFKENEPKLWKSVKGAWIYGYFGEGWADDMLPLDDLNKSNQTLVIGSNSYYGFKADGFSRRWHIKNLLEEIDLAGESFIDSDNNKIYFRPPNSHIEKVILSVIKEPIISVELSQNIIFENITIECSRGIGILIKSSNNISIDGCIIRNIGNLGIKIEDDTYNNKILNSYIYNTGAGGIELDGGNRNKLIYGNNYIKNCRIYNFNRIERSLRPGIHIKGVGNIISNVEIFEAPSMAIYLHGNNHTIEYTNIHHVCKEMHDCGAIYYGRNPTERGHQIKYSYFHDIKSPYALTAIYHDDGACGMEVYGCIFNNVSSAPVLIGGGQDITYRNNIFMNLPYAIQIDNRLQIWQSYSKWLKPNGEYDTKFKAVNYTQPPYSTAYPELLEYWENNPALPKRNIITNNIFYNVNHLVKGNPAFLVLKDNFETKNNPGFKDIKSPMKGLNYKSVRNNLPNFTPIPFEEIGCSLPIIQ